MLLVGQQEVEGHPACKSLVVTGEVLVGLAGLERGATATHHLLLHYNPEWFTSLVPAYPGCPEKRPLNRCNV